MKIKTVCPTLFFLGLRICKQNDNEKWHRKHSSIYRTTCQTARINKEDNMIKKLVCMTLALLGMSINLNVHGGNTSSTDRHLNEAAEHNTSNLKQKLINAVLCGHLEITRLLLPTVNLSIEDLNTGIKTSYDNDQKDILSLLISHVITHYPNKRIEDEYLKTAFTHAVNNNFANNDLKDLVIAILSNDHANASIDDRAIEGLFERAARIDDENFIGHLLSNSRCQMVIKTCT
jgi:hypothetical protein